MTDDMWRLAAMIWDWYRLPGNDVGGALHITLDDSNIDDSCLDFCRQELAADNHYSNEHRTIARDALGVQILDGLARLDERQRMTVVNVADPYGDTRPDGPDGEMMRQLRAYDDRVAGTVDERPLHSARLTSDYPPPFRED